MQAKQAKAQQAQVVDAIKAAQDAGAARAADHFLDQDTNEDRDTGSWLVATACSRAQKLASEIDDNALPVRRPAVDKSAIEPHDAGLARRVAAATKPVFFAA